MFKNYLKVALRNFSKHKAHSSINIAGLAVGIACFVLIMLYVQFESSFDRYHENADRIYRVVVQQPGNFYLGSDYFAVTQAVLGQTLMEEFPEVLNEVTVDNGTNVLISVGQQSFYEDGLLFADPTIFDLFTFPLKTGSAQTALKEPFSVVLSENLAEKYFGSQDPIGQTIGYRNEHDLKVTAVMKNVPKNSHYHFDMLISFQTLVATSSSPQQFVKWGNSSYYTYILVPPHFDPEAFEKKLALVVKKYHIEPWRAKSEPHRYYLQKLTDIHLYSRSLFDIGKNNDIRYIYLLSGLAFIILIIACINYMNLTTARAALRAREVGMRKVVGANRFQLLKQFIGESMLTTGTAAVLAILIAVLLLPTFSSLVEREIGLDFLAEGRVIFSLVAVVLLVGAISGSYPALYLTAYKPVKVLKGEMTDSGRSRLRSALVIFQFAASVGLIFSTATVQKQVHYIQNKKLGFNREQVLVMRMRDRDARKNIDVIKRELLANPNFLKVTVSGHLPVNISSQTSLDWTREELGEVVLSYNTRTDHDFLDVFEIPLVEGRNFATEFSTDSLRAYVINEKLRDVLGWDSAVGKPFGRNDAGDDGIVVGVIRDFNMHSLHNEIKPLFLYLGTEWLQYTSARILTNDLPAAIEHLRQVWQNHSPKYPLDYFFLDEQFNKMYRTEERLGQIFGYFTFVAIFIACLGLLGLASFTAQRKTKEIGIRKVLGASLTQILALLSGELTRLILFANMIAWPIAYFGMTKWLQGFAYRTGLGVELFLLVAIATMFIALLTISAQSLKAALTNPAAALRYE